MLGIFKELLIILSSTNIFDAKKGFEYYPVLFCKCRQTSQFDENLTKEFLLEDVTVSTKFSHVLSFYFSVP